MMLNSFDALFSKAFLRNLRNLWMYLSSLAVMALNLGVAGSSIAAEEWPAVIDWTHAWDLKTAQKYEDDGTLWKIPAATRVESVADRGKQNGAENARPLRKDNGGWSKPFKLNRVPGPKYVKSSKRFNGRPAMYTDIVGPGPFGKTYGGLATLADPEDKSLWFNPPDGQAAPYWGAVLCRPPNGEGEQHFGAWDAYNGYIGTTITMAKGLQPGKLYWGMTTSLGLGDPWPSTKIEGSRKQTVLVIGCANHEKSFMEINWRDAEGKLQTDRTVFTIKSYSAKEIFFGFVHSSYLTAAGLKTGAPAESDIDRVRTWSAEWMPPTGDLPDEP